MYCNVLPLSPKPVRGKGIWRMESELRHLGGNCEIEYLG
jgi:hypothetical protein